MARSKKLQNALNSLNSQRNNSSTNTYDENKINYYANQYRQREAASKIRAKQESAAKNNAINQGLQTLGIATPTGKQKLYSLASSMYDPNRINDNAIGRTRTEEEQKAFERTLNTKPITASEARQLGKEHPVWGSGLSILADTLGSAAALSEIAKSKLAGQPIDTNSQLFKGKTTAESYKEGAKKRIGADKSPVKNFLYETGMSTVESGLRALTMGPVAGSAAAGVQAGTSAFLDAKKRGASDNRAIAQGLAQGAAETFFEKFSLEGLKNFKANPADSIGRVLVNLAKQGFTEGSEEFATDWANAVSDYFIMGGDSIFNQRMDNYINQGLSEEQAVLNAIQETLSDSLVSFTGGTISGLALGGGAQIGSYSGNVATGNQLKNTNNTFNSNALREIAESVVDNKKAYKTKDAAEQARNTKEYLTELSKKDTLTAAEQGAALNQMRALAETASGNIKENYEETSETIPEKKTVIAEDTVNEGFEAISEENEKLSEKIQESTRFGKNLSGISAELMSDSVKDYNPDTVIKAARSVNDAVKYSGINANSFGDMIAKGAESELVQTMANDINVQMLDSADREALFKAALNDRLTFNNKYTFKQGELIPAGISENTRNSQLPLKVKGIIDDFGKSIGSTVTLSESLKLNSDGIYNTKTGNMMLSFNADSGTAFHEIAHMVRVYSPDNYKDIAQSAVEAYVADYGKDAFDKKIESIIDNYEAQTGSVYNYEDAEEEFVADTMKAFADSEYAAEFAEKHMTLAEKFKNLLKNICDMMNQLFDGYKDTEETLALKNHKDLYEKAYKGLSAGIEEAKSKRESGLSVVENATVEEKSELADKGVVIDNGAVLKYSLKTWNETDKQELLYDLEYAGYDKADSEKWIKDVSDVAAIISRNRKLDYTAGEGTWLKNNAETIKSLDGSFMCPKKSLFQGTYNAILKKMPGLILDTDQYIALKNMLIEKGYEVPCIYCYNESRVQGIGTYAKEFIEQYDGEYELKSSDLTTTEGLAELQKNHPDIYKDWERFRKSAHGAQRSIKFDPYNVAYRRSDLMNISAEDRRAILNESGVRWFAFSDFKTEQMIDAMQATLDLAAMNMTSYGYTKQENFVKVFGNTNIIINMSVAGSLKDGKLVFDSSNGMDIETARKLRKEFSETAGITLVGISDEHILAAMADPEIDMIIPFHRSGLSNADMKNLGISDYQDYQQSGDQNEHWIKDGKKVASNLLLSDYWSDTKSGKENAKRYLRECARTGREPKFSRFLDKKTDSSGRTVYMLKEDGSTDGYWKLLIDHKMYDNDGNNIIHKEVVPDFNMEEAKAILENYEGNANTFPVAQDVVDDFIEKYANSGEKFSLKADETTTIRDIEEKNEYLGRMNEEINDAISNAKKGSITSTQISQIADKYIKKLDSNIDKKTMVRNLSVLYDYINNTAKINARQLSATAKTLAEDIMDASVEKDDSMQKAYPNLQKELKSYRMTLSDEARADMAKAYDGYGNFRKKTFGIFTLVKDGTKSDIIYQELSEKYPDLFPADITNEADQVIRMTEVGAMLKPVYRSLEYGDDYDSIAYTIGQELIAEYFNANSNAKYLNEINAIKKEMRSEFAEKEKYLKAQKVKAINALTEKYKNAQGELKEKYKEQIKRLRQDAKYNLEKLNDHYRQIEERKSVKKFDRDARQKLLQAARSLAKMHGGKEFEAAKNELIGNLDLIAVGMKKDTKTALMKLREEATAQAAVDADYAQTEFIQLKNLFDRLDKKHIKDMSGDEAAELTEKIIALKYAQQTYQRTLRNDLGQYIATLGRKTIEQQNNVKGINISNELLKAAGTYKLYMLDPMRGSAMLDGYQKDGIMSLLAKGLNDGQTKAETFIKDASKDFNEYLKDHKEFTDNFSKPNIPITINGKQYMISKGMRISMYLHSLNRQNMKHIRFGGLQIPDAVLYEKGRYQDAYTKTKNLTLKPTEIEKIVSGMTEEEKEFAKIAYKFFNETTKNAINETSMVLNGYEKAVVENYFPINTDARFTKQEISGLVQDGTIEGMGMLKGRVDGSNPILLEDVAQVIMRQMQNTARYYGLAIPVRDFNKVFNHVSTAYAGSVKESIADTWGNNGVKYVSDILTDIQGGRNKSNFIDVIFDAAKGFHAQSVLTLNPSVAIKQSASYPFALTVLDAKSLAYGMTTAFKKADYEYMDSITPWGWARRQGMSGTEVGEVYKQKTVADTNSTVQSVKNKLNWIQMMDVWTTDRLFFATEHYVKEHNPSLEERGKEYNQKVAELYNTVLQRTQPSYDVMQRNAFLRDSNALLKTFTAFKTQTFNMGGELIDAWSRATAYKALKEKNLVTETDVENANKQFYRTVGATVLSQGMLTILATLANAVLHKPKKYRDEEGKLTPLSVFGRMAYEFMTSFAGMFFLGSEAQTLRLAIAGKEQFYDITPPQLATVNDLLQSVTTWSNALGKTVENNNEKNREALKKATVRLGMYAGAIKGIPSNNIYNIANSVNLFAQDIKTGTLYESGEGLFGLSDTSVSKNEYMLRMTNRLGSNDYDGYIAEYNRNVARFGGDEVNNAVKDYLKESDAVINAAEDWKTVLYGTDKAKATLGKKVSEQIGSISKTPSVSEQIDSALKSLATQNRNEDELYKEVKAINDKWEDSNDKNKSDKKKAEIRKLMRGKPKDEQRIIWRLAGYSDSTF